MSGWPSASWGGKPQGNAHLLTLDCGQPSLQNCEKANFCRLSHRVPGMAVAALADTSWRERERVGFEGILPLNSPDCKLPLRAGVHLQVPSIQLGA